MTTTDTHLEGWTEDEIEGWRTFAPTDIEGIVHLGDGHDEGTSYYAVRFTLYVDAENPEQASERAMALRHAFVTGENYPGQRGHESDFYWHLHDHDGC